MLLKQIIDDGSLVARGVYGFWPANAEGDDIVLFTDTTCAVEAARFPMLRQQQEVIQAKQLAYELAGKERYPDAEIDALVMFKGVEDIYKRNPNFNNVHYFNFMGEGVVKSIRFILKLGRNYEYSVNVYPANRKEYNIIQFFLYFRRR